MLEPSFITHQRGSVFYLRVPYQPPSSPPAPNPSLIPIQGVEGHSHSMTLSQLALWLSVSTPGPMLISYPVALPNPPYPMSGCQTGQGLQVPYPQSNPQGAFNLRGGICLDTAYSLSAQVP